MELGLRHVLKNASSTDWVLFVYNDTVFYRNFSKKLLAAPWKFAPAAVGSVICDEKSSAVLHSIGVTLDTWKLRVKDQLSEPGSRLISRGVTHEVDALSGRGALCPVAAFRSVGTMRRRCVPHYLADYELSVRIHRAAIGCL